MRGLGRNGGNSGLFSNVRKEVADFHELPIAFSAALSSSNGIDPAQAWKPHEIRIGSVQYRIVIDGDDRNLCIGYQIARRAQGLEQSQYFFNLIGFGIQYLDHRLRDPGPNMADVGDDHLRVGRFIFANWASTSRSSASLLNPVGSIPARSPRGLAFAMKRAREGFADLSVRPLRTALFNVSLNYAAAVRRLCPM